MMHISTQATNPCLAQSSGTPPTTPHRKLHARHGSLSAPDPLNAHPTEATSPRIAASRLSIFTLPRTDTTLDQAIDRATSPTVTSYAGNTHVRQGARTHGSGGGFARERSNSSKSKRNRSTSPGRLSFAQSSFTLGSGVTSPQSPTFTPAHRRRTSSTSSIFRSPCARLTAYQVYDLATATCNPSGPLEDVHAIHQLQSDEILPFVDRPFEVGALLAEGKGYRLMQMILRLLHNGVGDVASPIDIPPAEWTSSHLSHWLMLTTRREAPDAFWVRKLYQVIYPHSPPLWERLKGLLGIPLDVGFTNDGRMEGTSHVKHIVCAKSEPHAEEFMLEEIHTQPLSPNELVHISEDAEDSGSSLSSSISENALRDSVRGLYIIASSSPNPVHRFPSAPPAPAASHTPSKLRLSTSGDYSRPPNYGHTPNNSLAQGPSAEELRRVRERRGSVTPHFVPDFAHLGGRRLSVSADVANGA